MILHDTFAATPLDRTSLPQGNLDLAERVRTNPFPWTGQFSPQLVERLLTAYAPRNGVVLDPFVGSGTSLVEAARLDLPACGGDLNPAAVALARVYRLVNLDATERAALLHGLRERLFDAIRSQTHFLGLEHLAVMPSEIFVRWPVSSTRRSPHEFSIESPQRFRETLTAGVSGHANPEIVQHRKDPKIEQPVVKCAESEPIGNFGRPCGSMPFDVSGIKRDRHIFYANGKLAHCALAVVGFQYRSAERGVASAAAVLHEGVGFPCLIGKVALFRILWVECVNTRRSKDVIMKRIGKVCRRE